MTDEEKKAIEFIKSELQDEKVRVDYQRLTGLYGNLEIEILLNLIEKQSKEIEELSDKLTEKICKGVEEEILEEYRQTIISKDKEIEALKEDNKKKSIVIIEYQDLYEKLEDKIKAKIEEYENKIKKIRSKKLINEPEDTIVITRYAHYISVLQSLLEKE